MGGGDVGAECLGEGEVVGSLADWGIEKAPRRGAFCAKAQSDSVRASIYFTTLQILRAHPARSKA